MPKLYRVTAEIVVYIAAESASKAEEVSAEAVIQEVETNGIGIEELRNLREVKSIRDADQIWRDALPWGNNPDRLTCKEILVATEQREPAWPPIM